MSSTPPTTFGPPGGFRHWWSSRRRRPVVLAIALLVIAVAAIGIVDPFAGSKATGAGYAANADPTSTATVTRQNLFEQTQVNATLGDAGSYTVNLPLGSAASTLTADRATVTTDEQKVSADEAALASAKAVAKPTDASTLLFAEATVTTDASTLSQAKAQLAADRTLGCPASSSATVTTPVSDASSGSPASGDGSGSSASGKGSGSTSASASSSGSSGDATAQLTSAVVQDTSAPSSGVPNATTGPVDQTTNASTTLTGTVNPNGADTTYDFEYGTGANYGETTSSVDAGSGTNDLSVTVSLTGLTPGQTYHDRLVATNSLGTSFGEDATFETTDGPTVTTGSATTASASAETLTGTINPNGDVTTYAFDYGTSSSFGQTAASQSVGAGTSSVAVSATITGLKPDTTYDFAILATNALGTSVGETQTFQSAETSCVAETEVVNEDAEALGSAKDSLAIDRLDSGSSVTSAQQTLASGQQDLAAAEQVLAGDEADATNAGATFTSLPAIGAVITQGKSVFSLDSTSVPLFYGTVPPYRVLYLGVSNGADVGELNANLAALGFGTTASSDAFTAATESAVQAWQTSLGEPATGVVALGDIVVEPGPIEVDTVTPTTGAAATPGSAVLTATSTTPVVTIPLDASLQTDVKVGDTVTVTLPDNSTTPGVISSVGDVATSSSSSGSSAGSSPNGSSSSTPTIAVVVRLSNPKAAGNLNQASVEVSITNASAANVLAVPVDALLALANGGYALETVPGDHLVPVTLGLFDDEAGLVQVSGGDLRVGLRVVVPNV